MGLLCSKMWIRIPADYFDRNSDHSTTFWVFTTLSKIVLFYAWYECGSYRSLNPFLLHQTSFQSIYSSKASPYFPLSNGTSGCPQLLSFRIFSCMTMLSIQINRSILSIKLHLVSYLNSVCPRSTECHSTALWKLYSRALQDQLIVVSKTLS
jgi:hypothetical protein